MAARRRVCILGMIVIGLMVNEGGVHGFDRSERQRECGEPAVRVDGGRRSRGYLSPVSGTHVERPVHHRVHAGVAAREQEQGVSHSVVQVEVRVRKHEEPSRNKQY